MPSESITVMRSTLDFMHFCRFWPHPTEEMNPSKWFFVKFVIVMLTTLVNLTGSILHLSLVSIPHRSLYHIAEDLITITAQIGVYYFIIVFVPAQRTAAKLYFNLSKFDEFGKPPDFDRHTAILKRIASMYKMGLNIVVTSFFLEPILTRRICERENAARNFKDICGLVTPAWMPFDIQKFPNRIFFYLWQTYSVYWTYEGSASISYIILGTIEHVLIKVWHLKILVKIAIETEDKQARNEQISKCLAYHNHIFDLVRDVDRVYKNSLFVHVLFSGVLFGIMGFSILTVGISIKTISLFGAWVAAAIFASLSAQRLYDAWASIDQEVYNSAWYDQDYKFQKDLVTIMQRAQQPLEIHAGPFAVISNVFILTIFKTAYSYLTLLKASNK